jgi:hypothetical protein
LVTAHRHVGDKPPRLRHYARLARRRMPDPIRYITHGSLPKRQLIDALCNKRLGPLPTGPVLN